MKRKIICACLALVMLFTLLAACEKTHKTTENSADVPSSVTSSESERSGEDSGTEESKTPEELYGLYVGDDYEGSTFTILTSNNTLDANSDIVYNTEIKDIETFPDAMNNALLERQNMLRARMGVELKELYFYDPGRRFSTTLSKVRTAIESGSDEFQAINICLFDLAPLSQEGGLYDLNEFPGFNAANPWWNQSFNESVSLFNKLFFTTGDVTVSSKNAIATTIVNRSLCERLGLEDPVQLALNYQWTIDKAHEMSRSLYEDTNNNGIDYLDSMGWAGAYDDMYIMLYGSGVRYITPNKDGVPELTLYNERNLAIINKILGFMADQEHYSMANLMGVSNSRDVQFEGFTHGKYIFFSGWVDYILKLGNMEDAYAILPTPMYDEDQQQYRSVMINYITNGLAVALNVPEKGMEFVGRVLDTLGYLSWKDYPNSLAHNYYELVLKNQKLTNEESEQILDLIFNNTVIDMGSMFMLGWVNGIGFYYGGTGYTVQELFNMLMQDRRTEGFTGLYDQYGSIIQESLDVIIENFRNN